MSNIENATNHAGKLRWLRAIQLAHLTLCMLSIAAFVPVVRGLAFNGPDESFVNKMFIMYFVTEFILLMISVVLTFRLRKLRFGPREGDGLLSLYIALDIILATLLAAELMYMAMPLAILGIGVYNIYIAERNIRDLKITTNETELSA